MSKTVYINCSFCDGLMEVDLESGEVINKWSPGEKLPKDADKMQSALRKLEDAKKKRATLFDQTKSGLENQKKKLEQSFKQEVERLKKEGVKEKPFTPFDLD